VPKRRMRGTRLLQPGVAARQIRLDEAAIEEKDRRDREKLRSMVEMCYANTCRQKWILNYFGELDAGLCGSCDICREDGAGETRTPTQEEDLVVRKALSGVARMSRRADDGWEGRFGRGRIVQMLAGSKSQEILTARLDQLSTYGILRDKGAGYLNALMRSMADAGLVKTVTGEYPLMTLTPLGERVMRGEASYLMLWPDTAAGTRDVALKDHGIDSQLYSMLRDIRMKMAKKEAVPPYVIFNNKTLEALARYQPSTTEEALAVPGIGVAKLQRYAEPFLDAIRMWKRSR
jgi:ATP-dependent DNA helicase RecQ